MAYSVGQTVRVIALDSTSARKGMVSLLNSTEGTCDIIFPTRIGCEDEEFAVPFTRISALQEFESGITTGAKGGDDLADIKCDIKSADQWKAEANVLFGLKDYATAMEYYRYALKKLSPPFKDNNGRSSNDGNVPQIGHCVLVSFQNSLDFATGVVSDVLILPPAPVASPDHTGSSTGAQVDIMYDTCFISNGDGKGVEDEESGVELQRVHALDVDQCLLQRSIYMNMARCFLKHGNQRGWAIRYASMAIAISIYMLYVPRPQQQQQQQSSRSASGTGKTDHLSPTAAVSETDVLKHLADGYYFRGKALLAACRPKLSGKDHRSLQQLGVDFDSTVATDKAAALQRDIGAYKAQLSKSNRKLAKDIAQWVETAMSSNSSNSSSSSSSSTVANSKQYPNGAATGGGGGGGGGEDALLLEDDAALDGDEEGVKNTASTGADTYNVFNGSNGSDSHITRRSSPGTVQSHPG